MIAVDLGQHRLAVDLAVLVGRVIPRQVQQRPVALVGRSGHPRLDPLAELEEELAFALRVAGRLERLVAPLQQPLCLGERSRLLHVRGRGEEEHLGLDVLGAQFAGRDLGAVLPPRRRLDEVEVADHEPLQVSHAEALQAPVGRPDRGILAQQEVTLDLVVEHSHDGLVGAVRAGQPR